MVLVNEQRKLSASLPLICRCIISCILVLLTQLTLSLVPRFFAASPFIVQFALSGLVLLLVQTLCGWCRRLLGVSVSSLIGGLFNIEVAMIIIGLCSIMSKDPGLITNEFPHLDKLVEGSELGVDPDNENSLLRKRVRYCKICKAHVEGFDHHCPAFGNCIGQNNYFLFIVLLVGFLATEASYVACSVQFVGKSQNFDKSQSENDWVVNLATSTMLFSILQLLWQAVFFMWHIYCVCFNVRTDEWVSPQVKQILEY
ncbi:palmitoyltransferase ZDHHC3 isoform X2 [Citrus clementina]|uniref:palmitoyltransferase ZDHHC3 isoform X2 n=1 Tax=Citrus clementina TaxID=85681 RepID=UPI000CED7689|nr:palmitoyltransferase ZDHHC3 isoform X2 [Citrus x clementina]